MQERALLDFLIVIVSVPGIRPGTYVVLFNKYLFNRLMKLFATKKKNKPTYITRIKMVE